MENQSKVNSNDDLSDNEAIQSESCSSAAEDELEDIQINEMLNPVFEVTGIMPMPVLTEDPNESNSS